MPALTNEFTDTQTATNHKRLRLRDNYYLANKQQSRCKQIYGVRPNDSYSLYQTRGACTTGAAGAAAPLALVVRGQAGQRNALSRY